MLRCSASTTTHTTRPHARMAWQAADRLLGLNSKAKGGSAYLCAKVTNARNTLLGEPVPHHVEAKACMAGQGSQSRPSG